MVSLVFDIGGTRTRAGVVLWHDGVPSLARAGSAATPNHLDFPDAPFETLRDRLLDSMSRLANELLDEEQVDRVDVAFAGPITPGGEIIAAPTLWGARLAAPYALAGDLVRLWPGAQVRMLNDVTAAGYRYLRAPDDDLCVVTVSSGIGNKVFICGRPLLGPRGAGGELGHLCVDDSDDAPICECGGRGHLGAIASGRGVLAYARSTAPEHVHAQALTNGDLVAAFHRGDDWAVRAIEHGARPLGWALAAMHLGLGLERFVLFGGFGLALGEPWRRLVAEAAHERCWAGDGDWASWIELGVNDDQSGLIGAARAAAWEERTR